jgi:thiamine-phosphate pyrophosphorylase
LLTLLPEDFHRKITVHDHFYLTDEFKLGGIHLDDMSQEKPEHYKGKISRTCTLSDDIRQAKKKCRYVFLHTGSTLPDNNQPDTNALMLASRNGLIDKSVYALGGMTLDNVQMARDLGFGGVVIGNDLWNRFNIHNECDYKDIIAYFGKLRSAIE